MKPFIAGLAIIVLYTFFLTFQSDNNLYILKANEVKAAADDASAAASLYYDIEAFEAGEKIYDQSIGNNVIQKILQKNLHLDHNMSPAENAYWQDSLDYFITYVDDSGYLTKYHKSSLIEKKSFHYGEIYSDDTADYTKAITEPIVIVTLNAGQGRYRLKILNNVNHITAIRSSAYEHIDR